MADEQVDIDSIDAQNARDMAKYKPLTPAQRVKKQERFLKAMGEHGTVKYACRYAGISRQTFKNWKDTDTDFAALLPDAELERNDTLEFAGYSQAVDGVPSYVVSQGRIVYHDVPAFNKDGTPKLDQMGEQMMTRGKPIIERKYAPNLLITLLKANMPEKYKERVQNEHTGKDGGAIKIERTDYSKFSDEELAILEQLAEKAKDGDS
jgi:hypothetical protein